MDDQNGQCTFTAGKAMQGPPALAQHGRHGRHGCMWLITAGKVWRLMACRERHGRQRVVGIEPGSMRIGKSRQDWHGW
jgi:hypothetical protein